MSPKSTSQAIHDAQNYSVLGRKVTLAWEFGVGDFACGDQVDLVDFAVLMSTWNLQDGEAGYNERCDLVDDDVIDLADLVVFAGQWMEGSE